MRALKPSPAMLVALLALFIALGGVGYTTIRLPKKSVGQAQLQTGAVTGAKLAKSAVTGAKVKDGSLTGSDIGAATLGKVPSALSADRAESAVSADRAKQADTVDGQHMAAIRADIALGGGTKTVGDAGGLLIAAGCSPSGEISVSARTAIDHALLRASTVTSSLPQPTVSVVEDSDFNIADDVPLSATRGHGTATIVYLRPDRDVTTATIGFGELTGPQTCTVVGTLVTTVVSG